MRNLRKYFAVFVAIALLLTAIAPAFAADTATTTAPAAPAAPSDSKVCETIGMLQGDGSGVTADYLATTPSKIQAAIMFLRLKGLESEAKAFKGTESFNDADKVDWAEGKAILAYLKANPKLGFVGNPDGSFDPTAAITAQQYYKILLVSLGYVEGTDFKYEDVIKFADSKGLKKIAAVTKITINDVAVATVEALKANTSDGKKTLIQSLIDAKVVDSKKAETAGLVGSSGPATTFALKVKTAKSLYADFDGVVADTSKVAVTVTRDAGIAVTLTATFDADKGGVVLSQASNLVAGEYKVAIKNDTTDLGSKTVTIEAEKIAKIEMVTKQITRRSDSDGVAYYKVTNQYGDDVTKSPMASNITWNSSLGTANGASISSDKGTLTFHKNDNTGTALSVYMGLLKDQQTVVVTAYDSDSNTVMNDSLTVSSTIGDIQSLKLLGLSNKDKKTYLEKATTDVFYIDFEAKDSTGNLVTDYEIFHNTNSFKLSPGTSTESTIAYAEVVQDPDNNKNAKIQVKVPQANGIAGTQVISAISITTGKSASINVEVKEGSVLQQFVLQKPAQDVAVGDGFVEIPYIATDSNGNPLTDYSKIKRISGSTGGVSFSGIDSSNIKEIQNPDGSYKLLADFGTSKTTFTLSATVTTTTTVKMSTMSVSVKDAAAPRTIVGIDSGKFIPALVYANGNNGSKTGDKLDKIKINDQYDRPINLRFYSNKFAELNNNTLTNYYYFIYATTSDASVISLGSSTYSIYDNVYRKVIYGKDDKLEMYAGPTTGSATITVKLMKATFQPSGATYGDNATINTSDSTLSTYCKEVDSKTYTFYNVDKKDISSYFIDSVDPVLYAMGDDAVVNKYNHTGSKLSSDASAEYRYGSLDQNIKDTYFGEYMSDAKVRGKYNGMSVELAPVDILSYAVSDPDKFGFVLEANDNRTKVTTANPVKSGGDRKVFARYVDDKSYTGNLTAVVRGYNNVTTTVFAALTSKPSDTDKAMAKSIDVDFNDPALAMTDTAGYNVYYRPFVKYGTSGDIYKTSVTSANANLLNKRITQYSIDSHLRGITVTTGTTTINSFNNVTKAYSASKPGVSYDAYGCKFDGGDKFPTLAADPSGYAVARAGIYFYVKDQYGKKAIAPSNVDVVVTDAAGAVKAGYTYSTDTGILSGGALASGDVVALTAYTGNGVSKSIKIYVVDDYVPSTNTGLDYTLMHR